ncbi:MAG: hypothetical protein GY754_38805 [bacterium]|nr:hypothetical protein [bacterium]
MLKKLVQVFEVSADFLLNDEVDSQEGVDSQDEEDKKAIEQVIFNGFR